MLLFYHPLGRVETTLRARLASCLHRSPPNPPIHSSDVGRVHLVGRAGVAAVEAVWRALFSQHLPHGSWMNCTIDRSAVNACLGSEEDSEGQAGVWGGALAAWYNRPQQQISGAVPRGELEVRREGNCRNRVRRSGIAGQFPACEGPPKWRPCAIKLCEDQRLDLVCRGIELRICAQSYSGEPVPLSLMALWVTRNRAYIRRHSTS
jgi:hypothetical protein